ncbi:MAG TPA: ATP-binding protein [Verrucomicrobiae bacterium]|nr:ATP-binding protein [Verrucomicrobiae bacterium]
MDNLRNTAEQTRRCFQCLASSFLSRAASSGFVLILFLLATSYAAQGSVAKEIVSISQLHNLAVATTNESHPIRIKGVVLCCDSGWHQLYLYDGHETEYFNADDFSPSPVKGQLVEITGTVRGSNQLENLNLSVLGSTALPPAKPLEISKLGEEHGQWVQFDGQVMTAETSRGRLALLLHNHGQNCLLYVLGGPTTNDFKKFLGCRVRVRGINASKTVDGRLDSPMVFVPGLEELTVLDPADGRQAVQVASISSLLNRELGSWTNNWVHINGLIVAYQPGQSLVVKDPTGLIRAKIVQLTEIPGDERVDVWGFLEVSRKETFLNNAYFEVAQTPVDSENDATLAGTNGAAGLQATITSMSDIRKLRREDAARHIPVQVRGVLTYADPAWRNGFIQDKNDALYVDLDPSQKELQAGQWVELTGRTSPGGFAPEVIDSTFQVLGKTNFPAPARVDLEDLVNGRWDAHWIEMEGVVRRVEAQSEHLNITVMTSGGRFRVIIPQPDENQPPPDLIDALVRIDGACSSELNARRQLSGITLHTPGLDQIHILDPPPADPFALETTKIKSVATFDPDRLAGRRVKVQGVVTLAMPDQGFYLQDDSGGLLVLTRQTNAVAVGDLVDVLGFPAIGNFSPQLEEASFRQVGTQSLSAPKPTTAEQVLLNGTSDAQVVELDGRLLQSVPRSAHPQLVLQDGPIIFTASFETPAGRLEVPALESGSVLRLKGICSIQGGERHEPVTFSLLISRLEDIHVLETPSWWTSRHALMLAGGLLAAVGVSLAWAALLGRQVQKQTEVIRQQLKEAEVLEREILDISNREQRRIGHDLHDGVCQQLAGIALLTSSLADDLEDRNIDGAARAERISALLNEAIEKTRGVARGLFPVRLEEKGLVSALEELAANASELFKINCRFVAVAPPAAIEKDIALHLYYIVLEAVANASKHGSARNVVIYLEPAGDRFQIRVQDDGIGFSRPTSGHTGMGIRIMHYRARVIGATLLLHSQPGSGTSVVCQFAPGSTGTLHTNQDPGNHQADVPVGNF